MCLHTYVLALTHSWFTDYSECTDCVSLWSILLITVNATEYSERRHTTLFSTLMNNGCADQRGYGHPSGEVTRVTLLLITVNVALFSSILSSRLADVAKGNVYWLQWTLYWLQWMFAMMWHNILRLLLITVNVIAKPVSPSLCAGANADVYMSRCMRLVKLRISRMIIVW